MLNFVISRCYFVNKKLNWLCTSYYVLPRNVLYRLVDISLFYFSKFTAPFLCQTSGHVGANGTGGRYIYIRLCYTYTYICYS